jgi:hypothetical protein
MNLESDNVSSKEKDHIPEPVTRATFPARLADASPKGPRTLVISGST